MLYAGIGSRDLSPKQIEVCEKLGSWFAKQGHVLHTGNAKGADQAFARGANRVSPCMVHLYLPWDSYERDAIEPGNMILSLDSYSRVSIEDMEALAARHHPAWNRLKQGGRKLMVRNGLIIDNTSMVLAFPSSKIGGGGTGHGMRIARARGIELIDLNGKTDVQLRALCEGVKR